MVRIQDPIMNKGTGNNKSVDISGSENADLISISGNDTEDCARRNKPILE